MDLQLKTKPMSTILTWMDAALMNVVVGEIQLKMFCVVTVNPIKMLMGTLWTRVRGPTVDNYSLWRPVKAKSLHVHMYLEE